MTVFKMIFLLIALSSVIFFVGAGYLGNAIGAGITLLGTAGGYISGTMSAGVAAMFTLAVSALIAAVLMN